MGRAPNFLIVGAMRSGTSSLAGYLADHPDVFVTPRKEIHYFNRFYDEGFEWYLEKFAGAGGEHAVGEATPSYMYEPVAIERLAETLPEARLIAILREPVARAYSHYWFNRSRGREELSFEEALAAEPARLDGSDEEERARSSYFDRGLYAEQLGRMRRRFPDEQIKVVLFEDLVRRPGRVYAEVCEFLGVDSSHEPDLLGRQVNAYFRTRSLGAKRLARRLPRPLGRAIRRANRAKVDSYPPIEEGSARRLAERYREPNRELASLLERDLSEWNVP